MNFLKKDSSVYTTIRLADSFVLCTTHARIHRTPLLYIIYENLVLSFSTQSPSRRDEESKDSTTPPGKPCAIVETNQMAISIISES